MWFLCDFLTEKRGRPDAARWGGLAALIGQQGRPDAPDLAGYRASSMPLMAPTSRMLAAGVRDRESDRST